MSINYLDEINKTKDDKIVEFVEEAIEAYYAKPQGEFTIEDYYSLPKNHNVELIDGYIFRMWAPSGLHQEISQLISRQIDKYIIEKDGKCKMFVAPRDVQLDCDDKTMVQPDIFVLCDRRKNGIRAVHGAPDFVIEIVSKYSKKTDIDIKYKKYKKAGVREYWTIDPEERTVSISLFEKGLPTVTYDFDRLQPVGIYSGELEIDLSGINKLIDEYKCEFEVYEREFYYDQDFVREDANYRCKVQGEYTVEDYLDLPESVKVELIDGFFYDLVTPSTMHQAILMELIRQLESYEDTDKLGECEVMHCVGVQLDCDDKTMVQPDIIVCNPNKINSMLVIGAPELVIEIISEHSRNTDVNIKYEKYKYAGVKEYWVIDPYKKKIMGFKFNEINDTIINKLDKAMHIKIFENDLEINTEKIKKVIEKYEKKPV